MPVAALSGMLLFSSTVTRAEPPPDAYGVWWRGGNGAAALKQRCPWIKGVFAAFAWSRLEPSDGHYDWKYFDDALSEYANAGLYIQFMVWVGPHSPRWIYQAGVPEVRTTPALNPRGELHRETYPFYLDPNYQRFYWRMIRAVADHVDTLPPQVRRRVICVQTAEGTTGDEGGYKGSPLDQRYELPEEKWRAFKFETWKLFQSLYAPKNPKIEILTNSGNQGQYHEWLLQNAPHWWRKAGNPGHGYQLNNEVDMMKMFDPLVNTPDAQGQVLLRCRSEMDEMFKGWFQEAPVWNMYWLNLWGLHFGLDIFQHGTQAFKDSQHDEGFKFYAKYGGVKNPAASPGAWCALRDGLDAADYQRFPEEQFGGGKFSPGRRGGDQSSGIQRCLNIAKAFSQSGACQGDPEKAMQTIMQNRDAKAMNDVGWNVWTGNYGRFLIQYGPNETSRGYWRQGPKDQPYGRFARGFDAASDKNSLSFDLNDGLWLKEQAGTPKAVELRVVYFDKGKGSWALQYDAVESKNKPAFEVTNTDSGRWQERKVVVSDALFQNRCPNRTDLMLVNTSTENTLFHMIEVTKLGQARR